MRESSSFKIALSIGQEAKTKGQAVAERALTLLVLALLFLAKELFPMVREEVRLSCSSWVGMKQSATLMLTPGQSPDLLSGPDTLVF